MPLEVNEIGIVMRVNDGRRPDGDNPVPLRQSEEELEQLINECVRRVLEALEMERER
jgi:hypothetical protein